MEKYSNRYEAGRMLAQSLKKYSHRSDVMVLALPRGGVPVAHEIAKALDVPLDIFIVRKLGVPGHEELAMGAIAGGGIAVFNEDLMQELTITKTAIDRVIQAEQQELKRREIAYRGNKPFPTLKDKIIILVDDGIATGATMRAAIQALDQQQPTSIVVAVPVAEKRIAEELEKRVGEVVCPLKPDQLYAVGQWYDDFSQTTDKEVRELLA
ncbi:MAG: phosphoribosyltransferase [Gammaproteobacteria bacterium]|nr:MAG: phosphoribosyltransferase [Gammaproteobacteria bacterium]